MKIKVIRGQGDQAKADLISPLTSDINVALQLGRVEMDAGENWMPVTQRTTFRGDAQVGDIAESFDRFNGQAWRGIVTGIQHGLNGNGELITEQTLLRKPYPYEST